MLSYQHIYHAGGFADVQKHAVLTSLLKRLRHKHKALLIVDTHAGRGTYNLKSKEALKTQEFHYGISNFWPSRMEKNPISDFMHIVSSLNKGGTLEQYPGSAKIAYSLIGNHGTLVLIEKHPQEFAHLEKLFKNTSGVVLGHDDGFEVLLDTIPVENFASFAIVDPSYEVKKEYLEVFKYVNRAMQKDPSACFLIWYPILNAGYHEILLEQFAELERGNILCGEIRLEQEIKDSYRLLGSGLIIINPPKKFEEAFEKINKFIAKRLPVKAEHKIFWI